MKPTREELITAVCRAAGVEPHKIASRDKDARLVRAREAIVFLLREVLDTTYPDIAECMGRRRGSHSTSIDRYARARHAAAHDPEFLALLRRAWPAIHNTDPGPAVAELDGDALRMAVDVEVERHREAVAKEAT